MTSTGTRDAGDLARAVGTARARLVPFLVLMFTLAYLDRTNIGLAEQAFRADTGVSDAGFALGAGLFFVGYAFLEVPSNLILRRVGARTWLARIMVSWGVVAAATVFARGDQSFWFARFMLGVAEAGFFPGVILYLGSWFPRAERGRVIGTFYFGLPLALVLGNPLGGGLLALDGTLGLHGWQWLFLAEGALASAVGVAAWFVLIDRPEDAPWLDEGARRALADEIAAEETAKAEAGDVSLAGAFTDPVMLLLIALYTLIQVGSYGLAFSLPTTIGTLLGVKVGPEVGLVSAGPWGVALLAMAILPDRAVKSGRERLTVAVLLAAAAAGLAAAATASPVLAILALSVTAAGITAAQPIVWTFPTTRLGGAAAAGGIALISSVGNLGGFVAPNLRVWAEGAFGTPAAGFYALAAAAALAAGLVLLVPRAKRAGLRDEAPSA